MTCWHQGKKVCSAKKHLSLHTLLGKIDQKLSSRTKTILKDVKNHRASGYWKMFVIINQQPYVIESSYDDFFSFKQQENQRFQRKSKFLLEELLPTCFM